MFTNSKNLQANYEYEKQINQQLLDHSLLQQANYPPLTYYPGRGMGNYMVRDPQILYDNGTDIESVLRGSGSKALEQRDVNIQPQNKRVQGTLHLDRERMEAIRGGTRYFPRTTRDTPYGIEFKKVDFPSTVSHDMPRIG